MKIIFEQNYTHDKSSLSFQRHLNFIFKQVLLRYIFNRNKIYLLNLKSNNFYLFFLRLKFLLLLTLPRFFLFLLIIQPDFHFLHFIQRMKRYPPHLHIFVVSFLSRDLNFIKSQMIHHFRRLDVQRDWDGVRRASREEGGKAIGGCCASYSQPRIGAPWHQTRQHSRVQKWLLADQIMRFWRNKTSEHCGAATQRVAPIFAARGIADRHWRNVQVIIRLNHYQQLIFYSLFICYCIFFLCRSWFHNFESSKKLFKSWQFIRGIKKYVNQFWSQKGKDKLIQEI